MYFDSTKIDTITLFNPFCLFILNKSLQKKLLEIILEHKL